MRVIMEKTILMQWGRRLDCKESNKQIDFADDKICCLISTTNAARNNENESGDLSDVENEF